MSMFGAFGGLHASIRAANEAASARAAASRSESKAGRAQWALRDVTGRVDKLSLICMAMWELIQEKTDLTEEDLLARVRKIDLADGVADGKVTKTVKECSHCGRVMNPRHEHCLYCGKVVEKTKAFDQIT